MKSRTHLFVALWLIVSGSAGSTTPCLADAPVTLNADVQIAHSAVRLSDLFNGVPAEIDRDIALAPPPCKPAVYDETVLNKLADTYRLDWQKQSAADHAVVTSACARITADMIRDQVLAKLKQEAGAKERNFEIAFDNRELEIDLPSNQEPDFNLENFSYDPVSKRFHTDLTAQTPRGPSVTQVAGKVSAKLTIPVLAHRMEAGTTISENDLDWQQVPEEHINADIISDASQLIGRELRRDKAEDEIIHAHDVIPPRLVVRGSLVTMRIETPFMTVTTQGKAQQDGAAGEVVRVMNTQSDRVVEGTVTGPGVVEVHTAQKLASVY